MAKGYMGKILWVDLDKGTVAREAVEDRVYEEVLSGIGLGARILYSRIPAGADALGPDNVLGFVSGLLTGAGSVLTGRWTLCAKSPLTGGWGDANCGGNLSPAMKRAGVDGIFVRGLAKTPPVLVVDGEDARLEPAPARWGMDCIAAEDSFKARLPQKGGKWQVACIGPAGEKLSLISGVSNDRGRFAARSGIGAVMGSKKLKAIAVRGTMKIGVADKKAIGALSKDFSFGLKKGDAMMKILGNRVFRILGKVGRHGPAMRQPADAFRFILKKYGTSGLTTFSAENGDSPVKNFRGIGFQDFPMRRVSKIADDAVIKYEVKKYGCYSCPIKCGGIVAVPGGEHPVEESHKPEYETLCAFGTLCLVDDLETIIKINDICNRAGLDTISTGGVCAFAMECFERGVITEADTGGLRLAWGDSAALLKLVELITDREGIGDILADGVKRAAAKIGQGSEAWAIHAGGQELPMHDPRFDTSYGITYQCDPTPGRHTVAAATWSDLMLIERYFPEVGKFAPMSRKATLRKPDHHVRAVHFNAKFHQVLNGVGVCLFGISAGPRMPVMEWTNAATGWDKSPAEYLKIGERVLLLRQAFNVREGIKPKDFAIAERAVKAQQAGPHADADLDIDAMRALFLRAFGWDQESGRPARETLSALGLDDVAEELYA